MLATCRWPWLRSNHNAKSSTPLLPKLLGGTTYAKTPRWIATAFRMRGRTMTEHDDGLAERGSFPIPSDTWEAPDAVNPRPVPPPPTVPAGWYPDPDNTTGFRYGSVASMRYFDGVQWTEQRAPMPRPQHRQQPPQQPIVIAQNVAPFTPPVVVYNSGTNHGLHLVLSILTCGMWIPIWIILVIVNGGR